MDSDMATKKVRQFSPTRLAALRERLSLTQEQMAAILGVSPAAVGHWETNRRRMTGPVIMVLSDIEAHPEKFLETA